MSDDRNLRRQHALDRFWDGLVRGDGLPNDSISNPDLEPRLADAIRRVHALDAAPPDDPAFAARLWEELMDAHAAGGALPLRPVSPSTNGMAEPSRDRQLPRAITQRPVTPTRALPRRGRWGWTALSVAAVIVLLAGGLWRLSTLHHPEAGDQLPAVLSSPLPASLATPASAPPADETIQISGAVPTKAAGGAVIMRRFTLTPTTYFNDFEHGPTLVLVESGSVAFHTTLHVSDRALNPGDAATVPPNVGFGLQNTSTGQAIILITGVYDPGEGGDYSLASFLPDGVLFTTIIYPAGSPLDPDLPSGAVVSVRRVSLPPGADLALWTAPGQTFVAVTGKAAMTATGANLPSPFTSGVEATTTNGVADEFRAGTRLTARNLGTSTLVIYVVTLAPLSSGTPAP